MRYRVSRYRALRALEMGDEQICKSSLVRLRSVSRGALGKTEFSDCTSAVSACKEVVDRCLQEGSSETSTVAELLKGYLLFGDDPFIVTNDPDCKLSVRDYAQLRCGRNSPSIFNRCPV